MENRLAKETYDGAIPLRQQRHSHGVAEAGIPDGRDKMAGCGGSAKGGLPPQLEEYLSEHPTYGLEVLLKTEDHAEALSSCASFPKDYPIPKSGALYYLCENGVC